MFVFTDTITVIIARWWQGKNQPTNQPPHLKPCFYTKNSFTAIIVLQLRRKKQVVENRYSMIPFFVVGGKTHKIKQCLCFYNYNTTKPWFIFEWPRLLLLEKVVYWPQKKVPVFRCWKSLKITKVTPFPMSSHSDINRGQRCRHSTEELTYPFP